MLLYSRVERSSKYFGRKLPEDNHIVRLSASYVPTLAREGALPQEPRPGVAYIKVTPRRIISWDYSRQADNS
jgi:hypothetical protein